MTEARETAGLTMKLIVEYVRRRFGDGAVTRMLEMAGETRPLETVEDERVWSSYDQKIALFAAAAQVTGRPGIARDIGETVLDSSVGTTLKIALGLLGSPATLLKALPRANAKFSTAGTMRAEDVTATSATVRYRVRDEFALSRFDCDYTMGLLSQVSGLFDLPAATVEHTRCQVRGAEECVYHVRWPRRSRLLRLHRRRTVAAEALLDRLGQLQATLGDLVASTDVDEVLDAIAGRAGSAVNAERFLLAVQVRDGEEPKVRSDGLPQGDADELARAMLGPQPVALEGFHVLTAEVRTSSRRYGRLAAFTRYGFLDYETELLNSYAGLAATALEAVTAVADAEAGRRTAEALLGLAGDLHRAVTPEGIGAAVTAAARTVVGADISTLLLFSEESGSLRVAGSTGLPADLVAKLPSVEIRPQDTPELERILADPDRPRVYEDDCSDGFLSLLLRSFRTRQIAVVALQGSSRIHGVLIGGWQAGSRVPQLDPSLFTNLRALADQATNALDKAELMEQVRRQAASDDLTGIANRRVLGDRLDELLRRPPVTGRPALLFIDLDGFKSVNDAFGHAAGDELLRTVAGRLRMSVRTDDLVARLGGDEFTVLLSSVSDRETALALADHILAGLCEAVVIEDQVVDVSCSVGVIIIEPGAQTASDVLRYADAAMYGAKKSGGGRCVLFETAALGPSAV